MAYAFDVEIISIQDVNQASRMLKSDIKYRFVIDAESSRHQ
jgi:D-arabinose 1-dehydrogenase-like Zn-dependent alcohol dehydrogenase